LQSPPSKIADLFGKAWAKEPGFSARIWVQNETHLGNDSSTDYANAQAMGLIATTGYNTRQSKL